MIQNIKKIDWQNFRKDSFLKSRLFFSMLTTYLLGVIAHAYGFLHNNISHDSVTHFYSGGFFEGINLWKVELGRWFVPIYRGITSTYLIMPWFISIIAFFWIGLSVYFCVKMFNIKNRLIIVVMSSFMVINLTVTTQIATYIHEFDVNMFALFLAVLSSYILTSSKMKFRYCMCGLSLTIVLGIYQSYISAFLVLVMFYYILKLMNGEKVKLVLSNAFKILLTLICSAVAYFILCRLFCLLYNTSLESSTGNSLTNATDLISGGLIKIIKNIIGAYQDCIRNLFPPVSITPLYIVEIISVIIALIALISFIYLLIRKKLSIINKISVLIITAFIPFAMNVACFFNSWTHTLMHYSFCFYYIIIIIIIWKFIKTDSKELYVKKLKTYFKGLAIVGLFILIFNNIKVANVLYTEKELQFNATLSQMTNVVDDLRNTDGFNSKSTEVAFIGTSSSYDKVEPFDEFSNLWAFKPVIIQSHTAPYYFKYVLNYNLNVSDDKKTENISKNKAVKNMPEYPNKGYIKFVGDTLVVKLSQ